MLLRFGAEVGHLHQISPRAKAIVSSYGLDRSGLEDRYHRLASRYIAFAAAPICGHDRGPQLVVMRSP